MPPRAKPGNRIAIEAELSTTEREVLDDLCRIFSVRRSGWHHVAPLQQVFETAAVVRLTERLRVDDGMTAEDAAIAAARKLGVKVETVGSRLHRWPYDSYREGS